MKPIMILAAALALTPAFMACNNQTKTESEQEVQENSIKADKEVMDDLGDKGSAALAEPGTSGVDTDGDTVVTVVDMSTIQ